MAGIEDSIIPDARDMAQCSLPLVYPHPQKETGSNVGYSGPTTVRSWEFPKFMNTFVHVILIKSLIPHTHIAVCVEYYLVIKSILQTVGVG